MAKSSSGTSDVGNRRTKAESEYRVLWKEADELNRIFASIARKTRIK